MKKILHLFLIFFSFSLISCDNDENFEMVTKKSYFLAQDSLTKSHIILKIENEKLSNWAVSLYNWGEIGDMCGKNNEFWVSDVRNKEIIQFNAFDESRVMTFATNIFPHYICVGESHLLACDTIAQKVEYIELKNAQSHVFSLTEKPSLPTSANHKFYLKEGDKNLGIYDETNFGKRENLTFKYPIQDIQVDVNTSAGIWVQTSYKDTTHESSISLLSDNYNFPNLYQESIPTTPYTKKRYSPYSYTTFGKEYLRAIYLYKGKMPLITSEKNMTDFEANFFESQIYFLKAGKLYLYNIATKQINELGAFSGSFLKSYFYLDFKESKKTK